ncbi:MAG: hypothetical protein JWO37_3159 [Acidimicrobiales bacterium]|jgi:very-short-patch-repair endonuclease|nr:hypothetical protein [Acidimicrobiales bacterium]
MGIDEAAVAARMRAQLALIERSQALMLGMTERQIDRLLATGRWSAAQMGVYGPSGVPRSWRRDLLAAVLAAGPNTVASGRSAARLWGLDGCTSSVIEVTVPYANKPRTRGAIIHRTQRWFSPDLSRCGPLPATSVARTLMDLGAVTNRLLVATALEHGLRKRLVTEPLLRWRLAEAGGRGCRGSGVLRAALDSRPAGGPAGSGLEVVAVDLIRRHELPVPEAQVRVRVHGRAYLIDLAYPAARIAIEIDGFETHGTRDAFIADLRRQNDLVMAGWTVLRFTWDDIVNRPEHVATTIRRALLHAKAAI